VYHQGFELTCVQVFRRARPTAFFLKGATDIVSKRPTLCIFADKSFASMAAICQPKNEFLIIGDEVSVGNYDEDNPLFK
jgi:hypothetical protein